MQDLHLYRTDSSNTSFRQLAARLEQELRERDGADADTRAAMNEIGWLANVLVAFMGATAVGCAAFRAIEPGCIELKRMYVVPAFRRQQIAEEMLMALEQWAIELGYQQAVLETGKNQPEAIAFYLRNGFTTMDSFGEYAGNANSVCFRKTLMTIP